MGAYQDQFVSLAQQDLNPAFGCVILHACACVQCQSVAAYDISNHYLFTQVGVELDRPKGLNSGSVKGREYFKCAPNHGLFVRASKTEPYSREKQAANAIQGAARIVKAKRYVSDERDARQVPSEAARDLRGVT